MDWFKIEKGVCQGCILSPCLFNCYAEWKWSESCSAVPTLCIMWNAGQGKSQAGIKIVSRNISNFRYADDTILMAEMKRNYRASCWRRRRRVKKAGLKLNSKTTNIMPSAPITSGKQMGKKLKPWDFIFLGSKITVDKDCSLEIKHACSLEGKLWQT